MRCADASCSTTTDGTRRRGSRPREERRPTAPTAASDSMAAVAIRDAWRRNQCIGPQRSDPLSVSRQAGFAPKPAICRAYDSRRASHSPPVPLERARRPPRWLSELREPGRCAAGSGRPESAAGRVPARRGQRRPARRPRHPVDARHAAGRDRGGRRRRAVARCDDERVSQIVAQGTRPHRAASATSRSRSTPAACSRAGRTTTRSRPAAIARPSAARRRCRQARVDRVRLASVCCSNYPAGLLQRLSLPRQPRRSRRRGAPRRLHLRVRRTASTATAAGCCASRSRAAKRSR